MGDLQVWPQPNGLLTEENPSLASPDPSVIGADRWLTAEKRIYEIICRIHPTVVSERRRKAVVDYVQRLIRGCLGSEVFPFGSVPLKTYLPDGDIDLTALSNFPNIEDALANDVRSVLEGEEQNKAAEFEVKDVQYIHAEVKLVKCLVQNIVVDISFNQLGGLCTLCFLEQVDRLISKDHLFKRSIILIKAWCYYESRILGAHHGLISTYALETLVLYIFHLFHSSLHGPLEVLYRFLDHFSKFDWDNYCVSLNGPVCVSSLPEIVAETPENDGGDLLLRKEFLKNCMDMFSVPSKASENNSRVFPLKHLNIVDPLKENNNLGRSVSKGNFYRIRSAFTYGARKLGRILLLSEESIAEELNKFFTNTLDRHGSGQRPDVQDPVPTSLSPSFRLNGSGSLSSKSDPKKSTEEKTVAESASVDSNRTESEPTANIHGASFEKINSVKISEPEKKDDTEIKPKGQIFNHHPRGNDLRRCTKVGVSSTILESNMFLDGNVFSGSRVAGDATDLASSRISGSRAATELINPPSLIIDHFVPSFGRAPHVPHLYFLENGNVDRPNFKNSIINENKVVSQSQSSDELACLVLPTDSNESGFSSSNHERPSTLGSPDGFLVSGPGLYPSEDLNLNNQSLVANHCLNYCESSGAGTVNFRDTDLVSCSSSHEASDTLSDLSGDYDSHLRSLFYGQCCHELILYGPVLPYPPPLRSYLRNKHSWDGVRGPPQLEQNMFPHMNANGVVPAPLFPPSGYYAVKPPVISGAFGVEELPKPRGTGTYFPNLNHRSYKERNSPGRSKSAAVVTHNQLQRPRNNGRAMAAPENLLEKAGHDLSLSQFPVFNGNGRGKPGSLEFVPAIRPVISTYPTSNVLASERVEFGSLGPVPLGAFSPEQGQRPDSGAIYTPTSVQMLSTQRSGLGLNQKRVSQSYHLKDEDFPPLSV